MTVEEIMVKIEKATEKVEKCKKTIVRHEKQAEKKLAVVTQHGWNPEDKYCRFNTEEHEDAYWAVVEYQEKLEDIKRANKKLEEAERILENWKTKHEAQTAQNKLFELHLPEFMVGIKNDLVSTWTAQDIEARDRMLKAKKELSYEEFSKLYTYNKAESLKHTNEEFRAMNTVTAEGWVLDLYNRIKDVTGEVTDWSHICFNGKALNGVIEGKKGTAVVETILAGGYNIQRLHMRVLVKKFSK